MPILPRAKSSLAGADFSLAVMDATRFSSMNLAETMFACVDLKGAFFQDCDLTNADLAGRAFRMPNWPMQLQR